MTDQQYRHQGKLHYHRQDTERQVIEQGTEAAGAPIQVPADGAGLALQMKAQRQVVEMGQGAGGQAPHRPVAHPGKQSIAQFIEQRAGHLEDAISQQQGDGQKDRVFADVKAVHYPFKSQRDTDIGHLGQDQATQSQQHAPPEFP